jgi:hypothetical protein
MIKMNEILAKSVNILKNNRMTIIPKINELHLGLGMMSDTLDELNYIEKRNGKSGHNQRVLYGERN